MHEVLVNRLGGLSLPRKSVVRLNDRPDMTLDVYRGHKTTTTQQQPNTRRQTTQQRTANATEFNKQFDPSTLFPDRYLPPIPACRFQLRLLLSVALNVSG